jgi:hypothetical protein
MSWFPLLFFPVVLLGIPYLVIVGRRKSLYRLESWAARDRLKLIERIEPWFTWKGPFAERTSSQALYRVVVEDDKGKTRSAWVLCGSPLRGSWVDHVEVRWDEEKEPSLHVSHRFDRPADRRLLAEAMRTVGFRSLLLGPCLGVCIMLVMLLLTGSIVSIGTVPLLVIAGSLGVIVGGVAGVLGAACLVWTKQDRKGKSVVDEL